MMNKHAQTLIFLIFTLVLSSSIISYNLGQAPLENWDEGFYGTTVKEMLDRNNYIVLYFNDEVFLEKPPLQMWITVLFSFFLGLSELTIRLPSALSAVAVIGITVWYAHKKMGLLPSLFALVTLLLNDVFVWRSRTGNLDILTTLFFVLIFLAIQWDKKWRYPILGFLFGLLYLTKLGIVVFPIAIFLLHEILYRRDTIRKDWKGYGIMIGLSLILPSLWLATGTAMIGSTFWESYILNADQNVGIADFSYISIEYWQYMYYALQRHFFWFFVVGILALITKAHQRNNILLLLFSLLLPTVLSFAERKYNWYLVPAMPFWSLTIAYATHTILLYSEILQKFIEKKYKFIGTYIQMVEKKIKIVSPLLSKTVILLLLLFVSYKAYKTYYGNIVPRFETHSSTTETYSALYIKQHSEHDDVIVRTDHLYPATIYYSDRHVIIAPFREMQDIYEKAADAKVQWFVGKEQEIHDVQNNLDKKNIGYEVYKTPYDEVILKIM